MALKTEEFPKTRRVLHVQLDTSVHKQEWKIRKPAAKGRINRSWDKNLASASFAISTRTTMKRVRPLKAHAKNVRLVKRHSPKVQKHSTSARKKNFPVVLNQDNTLVVTTRTSASIVLADTLATTERAARCALEDFSKVLRPRSSAIDATPISV